MSVQPDLILAACPVCGNPTVKLDHVYKCVADLKQQLEDVKRSPDSECYTIPNGDCVAENCKLHGKLKPIKQMEPSRKVRPWRILHCGEAGCFREREENQIQECICSCAACMAIKNF